MRWVATSEASEVEVVRAEGTGRRFDYIGSPGLIDTAPQAFMDIVARVAEENDNAD